MKERPILFSGPMVRALLGGTKTQTRRICKPAMAHSLSHVVEVPDPQERGQVYNGTTFGDEEGSIQFTSPYGGMRDRLWVRECYSGPHWMTGMPPREWIPGTPLWFWADGRIPTHGDWTKPKPGMHMPRWASRILLEVTGVRVERLQDINQADAQAEGAPPSHPSIDQISREFGYPDFPRSWYAQLWEEINGPGSWAQNPWVWVVEFKRVQQASSGRPLHLEDAPCKE